MNPWIAPSLLGCALLVSGWLHLKAAKSIKPIAAKPVQEGPTPEHPGQVKLKIDSAYYGLGNANDVDVTETLQDMPRNALSVWVGNNLIPGRDDPAPGQRKRLTVHYSFGVQRSVPVVVAEHRQLVLPRDLDWVNAFVNRVNRRICILIVRLWRSTWDVQILARSGSPMIGFGRASTTSAGEYRCSPSRGLAQTLLGPGAHI